MIIPLNELRTKVHEGVTKLGYTGEDASIVVDVLMYAQLRGNNQGIAKIATGGVPLASEVAPLVLEKTNKCGALYHGGNSMVASVYAARKAIELAREHGVGVAASRGTHTSSGAIGYYARMIAKAGYITFVCVGNGGWSAVAPHGSSEARLGTNPLAYAFPYDGGEVVFDTATAAMAYYGVVEAMAKGERMPEGVAVNGDGEATTDPADILGGGNEAVRGALTTLAGHKGFGLSLFVQLLGSAFVMAGFPGGHAEDGSGTCIVAIDPALFADKDEYMQRSRELVESIKSARPIAGQRIILPGERGNELAAIAERQGSIDVSDVLWEKLKDFCAQK